MSGGTATFDNANVGTGKTVTAVGLSLAGADAGKYVLSSTSAATTASITKAASTTTTLGDGPFVYDTTTHNGGSGTVTGVGGLSTSATSLTYVGDQVNAGTYYVTAHYAGDANHEASDGAAVAITINKATSTTTTVGDGPFTYDGTTHTGGSGTVTGVGSLSTSATSLTYTGDQVNAGTYYVTAHYAGDANHFGSDGVAVAIVINKASSTTTTVGDGPFTYDGTTHTGGSGTVTGAGVITGSATLTYTGDQVNAGTYYVTAHYAGDANHEASEGAAVAITISKATSTTTTLGRRTVRLRHDHSQRRVGHGGRSGRHHRQRNADLHGRPGQCGHLLCDGALRRRRQPPAQDGAAVAITINKATSTTTTLGDGPFVYDTTTHSGGSGTVTGVGGLSTSATSLTYTGDQVNAGTYYVTAHYAGDANHEASDGAAVAITINKATSTTTTAG